MRETSGAVREAAVGASGGDIWTSVKAHLPLGGCRG